MKTTKTTTKATKAKAPKATPAAKPPILGGCDAVAALAGGKKKGGKATETQRKAAVAEAQAADAAANAHAVKPGAKTTKTTTMDAGGGIMVEVVDRNVTTPTTPATPAKATKTKKAPKEPKVKKTSGLDAAAQVLKDKGEPMTCKAIVDEMLAKGLWKTNGKTPSATIYSAMLREIDGKPGESRFAKTGRGLFTFAKAKA